MTEHTHAAEALGTAYRVEAAARRHSGWYSWYLLAFAAAQAPMVPAVLLWRGPSAVGTSTALFILVVMALSAYAHRQKAVRRGFGVLHLVVMVAWAALFTTTMTLGTTVFVGSVGFTVAAVIACALPMVLGAWREWRQGI